MRAFRQKPGWLPPAWAPPERPASCRRWMGRHRTLVSALTALLLTALLGLAMGLIAVNQQKSAKEQALQKAQRQKSVAEQALTRERRALHLKDQALQEAEHQKRQKDEALKSAQMEYVTGVILKIGVIRGAEWSILAMITQIASMPLVDIC